MTFKPNAKPSVLAWLNPFANGWLTIRQDKTRLDKTRWVLVPRTKTKTHRSCLSVNLTSKVISLASSLCKLIESAETCTLAMLLSTGFQQSFQQRHEWRC